MIKKIIFGYLTLVFSFLLVNTVLAEGVLQEPTGSSSCQSWYTGKNCGDYTVDDFVRQGVKITDWILGMIGSVSLLMFVYGGFTWLISQGESSKITEGKKIMTSAIIGIIIVFSSYIAIKFVVEDVMGMTWKGGTVTPAASK